MKQKQKALRRSVWASALAIVLCAAMLLGTTFAWFTDTVSSTDNTIKSGTLKIQLAVDGGQEKLFDSTNILWEPGHSRTANAELTNAGNLWLKYAIQVTIKEDEGNLANVLDVYTSDADITSADLLTEENKVGTVAELADGTETLTNGEPFGILAPKGVTEDPYKDSAPLHLAIKMQEGAGNQYQDKTIKFNIDVVATQYTKEKDGFNSDQYDKDAPLDFLPAASVEDLKEIIADAGTEPVNIQLTQDVQSTTALNIPASQNVTLDLDGHTLERTTGTGPAIGVNNGSTLTVTNGTIKSTSSNNRGASSVIYVDVDAGTTATVNLSNCTVENPSTQYNAMAMATNGMTTVALHAENTTFKSAGQFALYLPDKGTHTFLNCDMAATYNALMTCGGELLIDGGSYTARAGFDKFYETDDPYFDKYTTKDGAAAAGEAILIMDNRSTGYDLRKVTIRNATVTVASASETAGYTGPAAYGIRYINYNNGGTTAEKTIENITYTNYDPETNHGGYTEKIY